MSRRDRHRRTISSVFGVIVLALGFLVGPSTGAAAQPEAATSEKKVAALADDYFQLRNPATGMCLAIYKNNQFNGAPVAIMPCTISAGTSWKINGGSTGWVQNEFWPYNCLNVWDASLSEGSSVVGWGCEAAKNASWSYDPSRGWLKSAKSPNWCISVLDTGNGVVPGAGTLVVVKACATAPGGRDYAEWRPLS
ncbi:ricin-type beta-trefoil lectin domain protein [Micromonospora sp. WMMD882]|uniref:RICIN domain-containing protein n=1 Tax=Micromonospora sp. WMMD882 TaxID=3015151 RepID=UPI00248CB1A5|nr:ricin-type beta-trefoil lectin domain protein [Micromonospora sp. WMMD882]WBB79434.1 ricin-type beta-trefoil lectin domain protein [Micromonospora sp. WMMD882]